MSGSSYQQKTSEFLVWMHRDQKDKSVPTRAFLTSESLQGAELQSPALKPTSRFKTLPSSDIDFKFDVKTQEAKADASNVFYHAQATFERVRTVLNELGQAALLDPSQFPWQANRPIIFDPWGMQEPNAFFDPEAGALVFGYFRTRSGRWVDTCDSADIITHETGHAILHILRPLYHRSQLLETGAFHEHFGDMMAVFHALTQTPIREEWYRANQGDFLHTSTLVSRLATEFGDELYPGSQALRNADNQSKLGETANEVHDLSQVLTGAIFNCLMDILNQTLATASTENARALTALERDKLVTETVDNFQKYYFSALLNGSKSNLRFSEFAQNLLDVVPEKHRAILIHHFESRNINIQPNISAINRTARQIALDEIDARFLSTWVEPTSLDYQKAGACGYTHHSGGTGMLMASLEAEKAHLLRKVAGDEAAQQQETGRIEQLTALHKNFATELEADGQQLKHAILHGFEGKALRQDLKVNRCLLARGTESETKLRDKKIRMGCFS